MFLSAAWMRKVQGLSRLKSHLAPKGIRGLAHAAVASVFVVGVVSTALLPSQAREIGSPQTAVIAPVPLNSLPTEERST